MVALTLISFLTSLVSGVFGMAGGILMMGFLVWFYPVATAAILHGFVQASSNSTRAWGVREHILWTPVVNVTLGVLTMFILFQLIHLELDRSWVFLALGSLAPMAYLSGRYIRGDILNVTHQFYCGIMIGLLMFTAGVSGPVMDVFFAQSSLGRFEQVATKAVISLVSHFFKVLFFWTLFSEQVEIPKSFWFWLPAIALLSALGSYCGKAILSRVRDEHFQIYCWRLLFLISAVYLVRGLASAVWLHIATIG